MGKVSVTINVTNHIDEILAERGLLPKQEVRSMIVNDVLVDTGASQLCLPADIIQKLGVPFLEEIKAKTAVGSRNVRLFKEVSLEVKGRVGRYNCIELPEGSQPLLGFFPLEDLGLKPDFVNQELRVLPKHSEDTYVLL